MDKPVTLSVKHFLIRKMSVDMLIQERIIETVVNHQFDAAYVAIDTKNSLEFCGFGKFYFNVKKAYKKREKMESQIAMFTKMSTDENISPLRRRNAEMKLASVIKALEYLNKKLNENQS